MIIKSDYNPHQAGNVHSRRNKCRRADCTVVHSHLLRPMLLVSGLRLSLSLSFSRKLESAAVMIRATDDAYRKKRVKYNFYEKNYETFAARDI